MQPLRQSILALFVLVPVLALAGCQKGGDSTQPTAAVSGSSGEKADAIPGRYPQLRLRSRTRDYLHPVYEFETSLGKFNVRLDAEKAPLTADNFRNYVARGHYDLTIFHQVLKFACRSCWAAVTRPTSRRKRR